MQLIKNAHILTMDQDDRIFHPGYLVIDGDRIKEVGSGEYADESQCDWVLDAKDGILIPGMINCHTHLGMIPFRSLADDVPNRLHRFLFPLENQAMDAPLVYASSKYAMAEMLLAGITSFVDMYYFEEEVAKACQEMKIRGIVAETVIDQAPDGEEKFTGLKYSRSFMEKWQNKGLVTPAIAPHAPYSNTSESLKAAQAIAADFQAPWSIHLSEMDFEMSKYQKEYQSSPVQYLNDLGLLDDRLIAAHCIHVDAKDIDLLKEKGVAVAHCIGANTKSAKGVAPIKEMLQAGIAVGLGTDGPSSNNSLDLFSQMRLLANFHKTYNYDRAAFPAREIVRLATYGGAQVIKRHRELGSIKIGNLADLCLVETQSANMFPVFDPYAVLVYSANASNVSHVWVNGHLCVEDKHLSDVSLDQLRNELMQAMEPFNKALANL